LTTKLITIPLLKKYYDSKNEGRINRMREETGLSPYYIHGFLNSNTFEDGIEFLKKSWVMIHGI
jgi:hypothetical protein